jgi:hypothetical protein
VLRALQLGPDRLDGVVGDAGVARDDLTHLHLDLEGLEGEDLRNDQDREQALDLPVHVQVFHELFVPLHLLPH